MSDDQDPVRDFEPHEDKWLSDRLLDLRLHVQKVDAISRDYDINLLTGWHWALFQGIRDHAGRMRNQPGGAHRVSFGPHLSCPSDELPTRMATHVDWAKALSSRMGACPELQMVEYALRIHAEFIRIHPFDDGNGRVGRLILAYWCHRYRLVPPLFESHKSEYIAALNHYYLGRMDVDPLLNLAKRMYRNEIRGGS